MSADPGIGSSFFIIASLCVSFPPLVWSLRALHSCHKNGGRKPIFIMFLLMNVLFHLAFSSPAIRFQLNYECLVGCLWGVRMFHTTQLCGIYLHQLVALESVLSLRHPLYTTNLLSQPCSITLSSTLYLLAFVCVFTEPFHFLYFSVQFAFCLLSVLILTITAVFTYKAPSSPPPDPATLKLTRWVLAIAMVTVIVAYLPYLLAAFVIRCNLTLGIDMDQQKVAAALIVTYSMMSLRVISDTFLCVLVFKKVLPVQSAQTQAEPNALRDVSANSGGVAIQHP